MAARHGWMTRRSFLAAGAATLAVPLVAACSSDDGGDVSAAEGGDDHGGGHGEAFGEATGAAVLTAVFDRSTYAVTGAEQRLPLAIRDAQGQPELEGPDELTVVVRDADGAPVGEPVVVARHDDGVPLPFYPLRTTFPAVGDYELVTDLGEGEVAVPLQVSEPGSTPLLGVGDALPAQETPTVDDDRGVVPVCTRFPDPCPLHDRSLTAVEGDGTPTVLMVGTPAYCHIGVCGPVLELLLEAMPAHPGATYLHAEVYRDAEEVGVERATPAPIVGAMGLSFEPSLFVADADGIIVDRFDNVTAATEIEAALAKVA